MDHLHRSRHLLPERYRHWRLLLLWVAFFILFPLMERVFPAPYYHPVHCRLDDAIPFCEWFFIPYLLWYAYLIGMHVYLIFRDVPEFKRFMHFLILTYTVTFVVFLVYPTCQELRPAVFPRENFMTEVARMVYTIDTNTNVTPSLHIVGTLAVLFASWHSEKFKAPGWRIFFSFCAVLICSSTVFVKQHSFVDVFWGVVLSILGYGIIYILPGKLKKEASR